MSNYDLLVVGAGPAGLATARSGASVLVAERPPGPPRTTHLSVRTVEDLRERSSGSARARQTDRGEHPHQWTPERIRPAAGAPELDGEVLGVRPLTMAATPAGSYRAGPGLLVGDAAHAMTPVDGMGRNAAVVDGGALRVRPDDVPARRGTDPAAPPGAVVAARGLGREEVLRCAS